MSSYEHVVREVFGQPWYTTPDHLATIASIVRSRLAGERLSPDDVRARLDAVAQMAGPRGGARVQGAVGVIPIYGTIFPRANLMTEYSGGATSQGIARAFREALADPSIGSIVFDIDSPGGQAAGIDELATEIRNARGQKPMVAIANGMMASAAYYIGCQADELVASPSSLVGSIGCVTVHAEESKFLADLGVAVTVFRDPVGKAEGNPWEPLTDAGRDNIQQVTSDYADQFRAAVAKGRGVTPAAVKAGYGEGRVLTAKRALAAGLVDRIATLDETVIRLATGKGPVSKGTKAEGGELVPKHSAQVMLTDQEREDEMGDLPGTDSTTEAQAALALARARATKR